MVRDIHAPPSLAFVSFSYQVCVDLLQGWVMEEKEGPKPTSSATRDLHPPPLFKVANGYDCFLLSFSPFFNLFISWGWWRQGFKPQRLWPVPLGHKGREVAGWWSVLRSEIGLGLGLGSGDFKTHSNKKFAFSVLACLYIRLTTSSCLLWTVDMRTSIDMIVGLIKQINQKLKKTNKIQSFIKHVIEFFSHIQYVNYACLITCACSWFRWPPKLNWSIMYPVAWLQKLNKLYSFSRFHHEFNFVIDSSMTLVSMIMHLD